MYIIDATNDKETGCVRVVLRSDDGEQQSFFWDDQLLQWYPTRPTTLITEEMRSYVDKNALSLYSRVVRFMK
jgi:hypothetical protein